jgi:hypothetical protein
MKFTLKKVFEVGKKDYQVFVSDRILVKKIGEIYSQSRIVNRVNGKGTAVAEIIFQIEYPTSEKSHFGSKLIKHFEGGNAFQSARAWCNYLLNNFPNYVKEYRGHLDFEKKKNLNGNVIGE